jgi:hypothetical protein
VDFKKFNEIAELIGMTAIVLSLLFVGLQLRQSQQLAVEEQINFSNERQNAVRALIVANPDIWQKGCLGEPLDPTSRVIVAKIYDAWIDHVAAEYGLRAEGIRQSERSQQRIVEEMAAQYWVYPGLRELERTRREWHNGAVETTSSLSDFTGRLMKRGEELRSKVITPEIDTAWCGRT